MHKQKRAGVSALIFVIVLGVVSSDAFAQSEEELIRGAKKEAQVVF
jgi:hypothetical protein